MGLPLLASLALSAVGTGLSMKASSDEQSAMNDKAKQELDRQSQYQKRAGSAFQESASKDVADVGKSTIEQGAGDTLAKYALMQQQPTSATGSTSSNPLAQAQSQAVVGQSNMARSALQGYGTWNTQQYLKNLAAQQALGTIGQEAGFSAGALPLELQQAAHSSQGLQFAGQGLGGLGSLAGMYGVYSGLNKPVGATAGFQPFSLGSTGAGGTWTPPQSAPGYFDSSNLNIGGYG